MRDNGPLTGQEVLMADGQVLVSRTDTGGRITFVNRDFIQISGFTEEELVGSPHNMVRHPHMPQAAFADLWKTVKAGLPWEGLVKNRCKNGDHYWVRANVTPEVEDGKVVGFVSIRSKPDRDSVANAEKLYADMREGRLQNLSLVEGQLVGSGLVARIGSVLSTLAGRVGGIVFALSLTAILSTVAGLMGMGDSNEAIRTVYEDRVVPAAQLGEIRDLMRDNLLVIARLSKNPDAAKVVGANLAKMDGVWKAYLATYLTPEEKSLADGFAAQQDKLVKQAFAPIVNGTVSDGEVHFSTLALPLYRQAEGGLDKLIDLQQRVAKDVYDEAGADFTEHMTVGIGLLAVGALAAVILVRLLMKGISAPLGRMERSFGAIARGELAFAIPVEPVPDFHRTNAMLRAMRAKLAYSLLENKELSHRAEEHLRNEMLSLTETLEHEVQETVGDISVQARRLSEGSVELSRVASQLRQMAEHVTEAVQITSGNVQTVAGATEELEASSREILSQVGNSSQLAESARLNVDEASQRVAGLSEATARIGDVVNMIQNIAGQTRMLALNATIEAARAGEAGKGFAVVAEEVKSLANQTEQGIATVNSQADEIGRTTREAVETVEAVAQIIRQIDAIAGEVARATDEQRSATAEIMGSAAQAADHTRSVADNVTLMMQGVQSTSDTASKVNELSGMVSRDIAALQRRLYVIMRTSYGGDRRSIDRISAALPFTFEFGGNSLRGYTGDIDLKGAFLVPAGGDVRPKPGAQGVLRLEGVGSVEARIVNDTGIGFNTFFPSVSREAKDALVSRLEKAEAEDKPYIEMAAQVAAAAAGRLADAVKDGAISITDLMDVDYSPIVGTDPVQVMAKHTVLVERLFPELIEAPLAKDGRVVFCCITDRNGYIAAHNKKYSHPQRPGETVWNTANSRNRRVFDDRTGILAARTSKPLCHTYARDMGGGQFVVLKEMDVPIVVEGRHWGAVRMALKLG
ncbi:MAG: chemotaxis protein [Magnetospirillum sp. 64-120]|nr:MAG: chemotaxis protein [Magnetospirillum sp. 64-120]